jgi:hypothetical protein
MRSAIILTLVLVAVLLAVPLTSATVIHATINTKTNEGYVNATSNYVLYYTYPNNSSTSNQLNGTVVWLNATSYLNSSGKQMLGEDMNNHQGYQNQSESIVAMSDETNSTNSTDGSNSTSDNSTNTTFNSTTNTTNLPAVHVVNATLRYQLHAFANATNLTVYRNLTITLKVSNITKKVGNNTTIIDMSWRAFGVQGQLMSSFKGKLMYQDPAMGQSIQTDVNTNMDVNQLGDSGSFGEDNQGMGFFQLGSLFQGDGFGTNVMNYQTINFGVFSVPLEKWTRVYDSSTNSTTFFYNISSSYSLNSTMNMNGANYTIKLKTDPSAAITTNGNAIPTSANVLSVSNAAASPTLISGNNVLIVVGIVAVVAIGIAAVLMRQSARKK